MNPGTISLRFGDAPTFVAGVNPEVDRIVRHYVEAIRLAVEADARACALSAGETPDSPEAWRTWDTRNAYQAVLNPLNRAVRSALLTLEEPVWQGLGVEVSVDPSAPSKLTVRSLPA